MLVSSESMTLAESVLKLRFQGQDANVNMKSFWEGRNEERVIKINNLKTSHTRLKLMRIT